MFRSSFLVAIVTTFAMASSNSIEEAAVSSGAGHPSKALVKIFMKYGQGSPLAELANSTYKVRFLFELD